MKEKCVDIGTVVINYAEGPASGPPLVVLHGLATRWQIFRALTRALSRQWHVFAPDFRGHGKSGRVPGAYGVDDLTGDTIQFLRQIVKEPAILIGHSMGGWIAAMIAARYPEMVRAIVLIDTSLYPAVLPDDAALSALFGVDPAILRSGGSLHAWPQSLKELDPDVLAAYIEGRLVAGFDTDSLFPNISCPTLLLQGNVAEGGFMTDDDIKSGLPLLSQGKHVYFESAGHWVHVQEADRTLQEIEQFLQTI